MKTMLEIAQNVTKEDLNEGWNRSGYGGELCVACRFEKFTDSGLGLYTICFYDEFADDEYKIGDVYVTFSPDGKIVSVEP